MNISKKEILVELIMSDVWPQAINEDLLCNTHEQKMARANTIVNFFIDQDLHGLKFLDFGCGENHVIEAASMVGADVSVGYDLEETSKGVLTDIEDVRSHGPYDVILLYDVIDHAVDIGEGELLKQANDLLSPKGKIYMRCHPWVSRSATHIYKQLNKAYAHLFIDEDDLRDLGCDGLPTLKSLSPQSTYEEIIEASGLEIERQCSVQQDIEPFLVQDPMLSVLNEIFRHKGSRQIEQQFIDYVLTRHARKNKPFKDKNSNNKIQM